MFLITIVSLGGCASLRVAADKIATPAGLVGQLERTADFELLTYRRGFGADFAHTAAPVHVYLEGDGRAWRFRSPPTDPTPRNPLGLRLAARDPAISVLWIGRPCMYQQESIVTRCGQKWWTSHRYATKVIDAMDELISRIAKGRQIRLIGHSGGGALAVLVASRRDDVHSVLTVGSPLDLDFWAKNDDMTPLKGSINPTSVAPLLANLRQRHLVGGKDKVVPTEVVRRFIEALPKPNNAVIELFPTSTHICCWEHDWPDLLVR